MKKTWMLVLCLISALSLTACLDVDSMRVRYDLDRNLDGKLTLEFKGIHAESEKEMQEFYGDYQGQATDIVREWGIEKPEVTLENSTASRCDGKVTGEMQSFLRSLEPILEDASYEIKKSEDSISVHIQPRKSDEPISLALRYAGKVIKSNSQMRDQPDGYMQWDFQKLDERGIEFELDLAGEEKGEKQ